MSTLDKIFADRIAAGNGWLDGNSDNSMGDNPRCTRIVRYLNAWGGFGYGCTFEGQDQNQYMRQTEFVRSPTIYWEAT